MADDTEDEFFSPFVSRMKTLFPDKTFEFNYDIPHAIEQIDEYWIPDIAQFITKDATFFQKPRILCDINISELVTEIDTELWLSIVTSIGTVYFSKGDFKSKIGKIFDVIKNLWQGEEDDEVSKILNDERSKSKLEELYEVVCNLRIIKFVKDFFIEIQPQLEEDLKTVTPEVLQDIMKDPKEHPIVQKIILKVRSFLQNKLQTGQFSQADFNREVEFIKAKVVSLFGSFILGGSASSIPAQVLVSNSPEARRQRMLARLQKKHQEKNSM